MHRAAHRLISNQFQAVRLLRREVIDVTPGQLRAAVEAVARIYPGHRDAIVERSEASGVKMDIVRARTEPVDQTPIIWAHGGGFAFGSARTHRAAASHLALQSGRAVWLPDYGLAPEHPFPVALKQVSAVIGEAIERYGSCDLVGDSAGGNLALASCLYRLGLRPGGAMEGEALALPQSLSLLSPWLDLRLSSPSYIDNAAESSLFDKGDMRYYSSFYLAGHAAGDMLTSPAIMSDELLAQLPPIRLESTPPDYLHPDAQAFYNRLDAAGHAVQWREVSEVFHSWQLLPDVLPEAARSIKELADFIRDAPSGLPARPATGLAQGPA